MAETIGPQGLVESHAAVLAHGGRVVALGKLAGAPVSVGASPRQAMVLVEWESPEAFQGLLEDPGYADLHPLRENGTLNYLWWTYDRLEVPAPAAERGTRLYRRVLSAHNATRRRTCGAA